MINTCLLPIELSLIIHLTFCQYTHTHAHTHSHASTHTCVERYYACMQYTAAFYRILEYVMHISTFIKYIIIM